MICNFYALTYKRNKNAKKSNDNNTVHQMIKKANDREIYTHLNFNKKRDSYT